MKNGIEVTLNPSLNLIETSNDETNFPHKLLSTNWQVSKTGKTFANGSHANTKFSKTQLSKMVQLGGFIFGPGGITDFFLPSKMLPKIINKADEVCKKWHLMM